MTGDAAVATDDLFENAPCGLLVTTTDDVVIRTNQTFLDWTGFSAEDVLGRAFHYVLDPGSQAFYATRYQAELWARGAIREVAFTLIRADGTPMPILVNAEMTGQADPASTVVRMAIFDSTVRHDYEREMLTAKRLAEKSESSLRVLQEASSRFLAASTDIELSAELASIARDAFAASEVAVLLADERGNFRVAAGEKNEQMIRQLVAAWPIDPLSITVDAVISIASLDKAYAASTRVGDLLRKMRTEAFTAVPIAEGNRILGAIVCFFGRPRALDQQVLELQRALARQASLVLSRVRLQNQLERLARYDQLTGLANRTLVTERISQTLEVSRSRKNPIAIIFIDLDGFKLINDRLGHRVGDMVLQTVSDRMRAAVRDMDIVGRFGGDEFVIVCEDADADAARAIADRLASAVREPIPTLAADLRVTASVGVALHSSGSRRVETSDSLVRRADAAMYESKRSGSDHMTFSAS